MKTKRVLVVLLLVLSACGSDSRPAEAGSKPKVPRTDVEVVTDWSEGSQGFREVRINHRLCIESRWISDVSVAATGGVTCFFGGG